MLDIQLSDLSKEVKKMSLEPEQDKTYDVIVIGAGPAGMTACVYLARKKLSVLVISNDFGGQVLWTSAIENYMGYQYILGRDLATKFTEQVNSFPIAVRVPDEVIAVERENGLFLVQTRYEGRYRAQALVITSGKRPRMLDIPGEKELVGRGVSYCATCDTPLYVNKITAVIGGANSAVLAALDLHKVAQEVHLIVRSKIKADNILVDRLQTASNVKVYLGYIPVAIKGSERVEGLLIRNLASGEEKLITVDGVFIEAGLIPNSGFLRDMVKTNERNEIIVNCNCETSEKGIFAAGDVSSVSDKQIIIACGEGAKAALSAYRYLMTNK